MNDAHIHTHIHTHAHTDDPVTHIYEWPCMDDIYALYTHIHTDDPVTHIYEWPCMDDIYALYTHIHTDDSVTHVYEWPCMDDYGQKASNSDLRPYYVGDGKVTRLYVCIHVRVCMCLCV